MYGFLRIPVLALTFLALFSNCASESGKTVTLDDVYLEVSQGNYEVAENMTKEIISRLEHDTNNRQALGDALMALATHYTQTDRLAEAEPILLRCLDVAQDQYGRQAPELSFLLSQLGVLYLEMRKFEKAEEYLMQALRNDEKGEVGADYRSLTNTLRCLGLLYLEQDNLDLADTYFSRAYEIYEDEGRPEHGGYAKLLRDFAKLRAKQGKTTEAKRFLEKALDIYTINLGADHHYAVETELEIERIGRE